MNVVTGSRGLGDIVLAASLKVGCRVSTHGDARGQRRRLTGHELVSDIESLSTKETK